MQSAAVNPLPKAVYIVADRIGLNFSINRKKATEDYVEQNKDARLDLSRLKNSYYSLNEVKTRRSKDDIVKPSVSSSAKNPLKLNARIRKKLYKLSSEEKQQLNYGTFEKIHNLWIQYASKVLETNNPANIFTLDLHGCKLTCTASRNPTLVGAEGIVFQETKHTFIIIKSTSRLITIPKRESIFEFNIKAKRYRIHGCNLLFTVQSRTKVKYKQKRHSSEV